jgi:hypothetical protein
MRAMTPAWTMLLSNTLKDISLNRGILVHSLCEVVSEETALDKEYYKKLITFGSENELEF